MGAELDATIPSGCTWRKEGRKSVSISVSPASRCSHHFPPKHVVLVQAGLSLSLSLLQSLPCPQ